MSAVWINIKTHQNLVALRYSPLVCTLFGILSFSIYVDYKLIIFAISCDGKRNAFFFAWENDVFFNSLF